MELKNVKKQAYELKARIDKLKEEQYDLEGELYELQKAVKTVSRYGDLVVKVTQEYKPFGDTESIGEVVQLAVYLLNEDEKEEHMRIFGSISGDWGKVRHSVTYFRNEYGVLNHTGGGWVLLKDGIPCSDEEWEAIKQGDIPAKFATKNLG